MKNIFILNILLLITITTISAQPKWKQKKTAVQPGLQLFHSNQVVNLSTAETLNRGEWEYEISHRFLPTITTDKAFGGIDGPANIRMGLSWAPFSKTMITAARSNLQDQWDFQLKYKAFEFRSDLLPVLVGVKGGVAYTGDTGAQQVETSRKWQYYLQIIANTMVGKKLGIGVVPSFVGNSHIYCPDVQHSFTTGLYAQYYLSAMWSVFAEGNLTVSGFRDGYDSLTLGVEIETGGHFFKIFLGNNARINPTQYLSGSDLQAGSDNWRLGFVITRLLVFK